jgi:hypothetical protein
MNPLTVSSEGSFASELAALPGTAADFPAGATAFLEAAGLCWAAPAEAANTPATINKVSLRNMYSFLRSLHVGFGGNRIAPSVPERLRGDLDSWRRLLALVFTAFHHTDYATDQTNLKAPVGGNLLSGM